MRGRLLVIVAGMGLLAACAPNPGGGNGADAPAAVAQAAVKAEFSVRDGETSVSPSKPVTVTAQGGELESVTMTNAAGKQVKATLSKDKGSWTTAEDLGYGKEYTVTAKTSDGKSHSVSFTTVTPAAQASVLLSPIPDSTVGVAQTINFIFDYPVEDTKAVEDAISIETSNNTEGAFHWFGPQDLRWRPKEFWQPGTKVTVNADIYGVKVGEGAYGAADNTSTFTIGDEVKTIIDDSTKTMSVYQNGQLLRSIPVSLGSDVKGYSTPNGTYTVGDIYPQIMMDSETFGLPHSDGGYKTLVDSATQLSYSGIFVHSAPWSVGAQGNTNTSHGCVNVTPEAAAWYQQVVKRGDPVIIQNTQGGTLAAYDGLGSWNLDWSSWKSGEADEA